MEYRKLKDLVEINSENITKNYKEQTINYLDTANITNGKIDKIIKLGIEKAPSRAKRIVRENDIIYSTVRPNLCHYGILRKVLKNMIVSTGFVVLRCKEEILPEYLYAYITLPFITEKLHSIAETSTSAYPSIKPKDIESLDMPVPPKEIQQKIANIISSIDKKIEINNHMNDNLQAIINSIFISWFIDFEFPNIEGHPYKSSNGYMIDSELGEIPENWKVIKLEEIIDFSNGYSLDSKKMLDKEEKNTYKVFKMGNIKPLGGINKNKTKSWLKKEYCVGLEKYISKKGDILMCMTDMKNSDTPLLGHTALIDKNNEFIINQRVGILRCKKELVNYSFLYTLTNLDIFVKDIRSRANSGVQVNLSTKGICETSLILPDKKTLYKFNNIAEPMYEQIFKNNDENEILIQIRDTLLPKLIQGEINLDNIEI